MLFRFNQKTSCSTNLRDGDEITPSNMSTSHHTPAPKSKSKLKNHHLPGPFTPAAIGQDPPATDPQTTTKPDAGPHVSAAFASSHLQYFLAGALHRVGFEGVEAGVIGYLEGLMRGRKSYRLHRCIEFEPRSGMTG